MATYSKTHVLIDSRDRKAGTPSEYYVALQPKIRDVVKLKFNTFDGGAFPYTFREDTLYVIDTGRWSSIDEQWGYRRVTVRIPMGLYTLDELVSLLNAHFIRVRIRIEYSEIDHRVIISKCNGYFSSRSLADGSDPPYYRYTAASPEGRNTYVDTLLGFPRGWAIAPDESVYAVRSSYAVQKQFLPNTLMIAFSNFPSKVVSSSGIIGELAIPYTSRTFDFQTNKITWSENTMFSTEIETYAEYIDHLGIRIVDSRTGEKYHFMEEHIIQVEITHADVKSAKPFPNGDLSLLD